MNLDAWVESARQHGASDLHLEPGLPCGLRIRGELKTVGPAIPPASLQEAARSLLDADEWNGFLDRRSADLSRVIKGVRCRINVLKTVRGVGFAIRLLSSAQPTLKKLNLHPSLRRLIEPSHGLVLVSGATGSGKTSTLAALIHEINATEARHILTLESPIEYVFTPRASFIRQRDVDRDTPSFEQGLLDAMREDPDVLMVGEMRDSATMRLTLNAAETGHLVLATVHSATAAEALQRVISAFPPESQPGVCTQLADCLVAVVAQRLHYRPDLKIRVPECEILFASTPVKALIRTGQFYKIASALESGGADGNWTFARYREWLETNREWFLTLEPERDAPPDSEPAKLPPPRPLPSSKKPPSSHQKRAPSSAAPEEEGVFVLEHEEDDPESVMLELEQSARSKKRS